MAMAKHKVEMNQQGFDTTLLLSVLLLTGMGIVMVYSASSAIANNSWGNSFFFIRKQAVSAVIGCVLLMGTAMTPYRLYRKFAYIFLAIAAFLVILTQVPGIGHSAGGAARWIKIGAFSMQPSEFARLAFIIYLAYSITKKQELIKDFSIGFLPHVIFFLIFAILIMLQPDFGSVAILAMITWIMMFVGGVSLLHLLLSLLPMIPVGIFVMVSASYRMDRLVSFLDPWKHRSDEGYQIVNSLMAFGSGGVWGKGLGNGYQKLFYLPEPHTDFIFSVIGEELGLWGVLLILSVFAVVILRGIVIARNTEDMFGSLLATGIVTGLGLQTCINMGVALGLLPTKGLALPFLSYGGSSLLINMAAVGILINIAKTGNNDG
ncbi:MAG: putative lipid II flippase FtsW [Desulfobacteraceae bacterium]|jgi:cell division protein FtsW